MIKKVFIANVRENDNFAVQLHDYLTAHDISCFQYSIDLLPGQNITQETKNRIEESDHCIICFSKELNDRHKTDMRREIYLAIVETYQRKPNSKFLIPIKVNQCEVEDFRIDEMTSMKDLWYADFNKDNNKAHQDLLKTILGSGPEDSTDITEKSIEQKIKNHLKEHISDQENSLRLLKLLNNLPPQTLQIFEKLCNLTLIIPDSRNISKIYEIRAFDFEMITGTYLSSAPFNPYDKLHKFGITLEDLIELQNTGLINLSGNWPAKQSNLIAYPITREIYLYKDINTNKEKQLALSGIIYTELGKELFVRIHKTFNILFFEEVKKYFRDKHKTKLVPYRMKKQQAAE